VCLLLLLPGAVHKQEEAFTNSSNPSKSSNQSSSTSFKN
jgi:hypothetical protein